MVGLHALAGRALSSPADARKAVADKLAKASGDPAPVARLELDLARDDAECANVAGLWSAFAGAQARAEQDELTRVGSAVQELRRATATALTRAATIAGGT